MRTNGFLSEGTKDLGSRINLPESVQQTLTIPVCKFYLNIAWKTFNGIKQQAREHRRKFLREKAKEQAAKGNHDVQKIIKQIRHKEQIRQAYTSIRRGYGVSKMGLATLDVPDESGGRKLITRADEIHAYLLQRNEKHFGQATYTTFGDAGPGFEFIDPANPESDTHIDAMLDGVFEPWESASPYVREFLSELKCTLEVEVDTKLTLHDFINLFKKIPESTASSVSGLHYGHYRVLSKLEDTTIIKVLFDIVDIAFITHSPLPRWQHVTQLMLEKGKGPAIENLRVIQLLEADLNWLLRLLWGKRLDRHATEAGVYNEAQFASPGKLCQSAIVNKVLFFDLLRQNRYYGALIDNDATAAFDRVLPALCVVTCRQLGMPKAAQRFFFKMLRQTIYTTTTAHGRSAQTYSATANPQVPGQGVMQGGGASLPNYKSQQLPVLKAVESNGTPAMFSHASRLKPKFKRWVSGFSDDISLFLNELGVRLTTTDDDTPIIQRVRKAVQLTFERYEEYFFTAGGSLNLKKCFYYFVGFTWTGSGWRYNTNDEMPIAPISIKPTTLGNEEEPQQIRWCEATDAQRTLGSFIAPDGSCVKQIEVLKDKLCEWQKCLNNLSASNLTAAWLSYKTVFMKKVLYPLIGHTCSTDDLLEIQKTVDREVLHILGLNEHFPRAVLHAPFILGGLGCTTIHGEHIIGKILLFVHHMREKGQINEALLASMSTTQIEVGSSEPFFTLDANIWHNLVTPTWTSHIWKESQAAGIDLRFHKDCFWVPKPVRERDISIMSVAATLYSGTQLYQINMCRLSLKVTFLSDIASVDGKRILLSYYMGKSHQESGRRTRINWPPVGTLPNTWWDLWKNFLEKWCGTSLLIAAPLGRWYADAEMLTQCCCMQYERRLIMQHKDGFYEFLPYSFRSKTRYKRQAYRFDEVHLLATANVVDITFKGEHIYIIATSPQNVIDTSTRHNVTRLQDLYCDLPADLQCIIGRVEWPSTQALVDVVDSILSGQAIGVSDGSVRESIGKASHAWTIQAMNGSEIKGSGPVDGSTDARTSHRAEMQGSAALMLMVALVVKFFKIAGGKLTTYCDNQSVVQKLQKGWTIWKYRSTKGPDGDLQALLRDTTQQLRLAGTQTEANWVKGHQDNDDNPTVLSRQAMLNVQMDYDAKCAYDFPPQFQTTTFVPVFQAEVCAVYIGDIKITSNIQLSLSERWHEREAREYLWQRHQINTEVYQTIYWQALRFALKKLSAHRRATAVKALHRHLPSQEKLFTQGRVTMSALCPRCLTENETNIHILQCTNEEAIKQRKLDWVELWKQLTKCRTANVIEQTWRYYLQPILGIPLGGSIIEGMTIAHGELGELLSVAVAEQTAIGWEKLLLGLGSTKWKLIQATIDASHPRPPQRSASAWMNTAIHTLIKFSLRCWKKRNAMIHGCTGAEQRQIALQQVRDKIKAIYQDPPKLAPQFSSVYEIPLEHRLKMSLQTAEQWLSLIAHQMKVTQHNFQCLLRRHKSMHAHLRTMRREARSQAKERELPATPTKQRSREIQKQVREMKEKLYAMKPKTKRGPHSHRKKQRISAEQSVSRGCKQHSLQLTTRTNLTARPQLRLHPP